MFKKKEKVSMDKIIYTVGGLVRNQTIIVERQNEIMKALAEIQEEMNKVARDIEQVLKGFEPKKSEEVPMAEVFV